jgi:hypothetical protein
MGVTEFDPNGRATKEIRRPDPRSASPRREWLPKGWLQIIAGVGGGHHIAQDQLMPRHPI